MGCHHSKIACGCGNHIVDRDGKEYCLPSCQTEDSIEKAEREFLRFKARQLLAMKKGRLKARGYKSSKPPSIARDCQASANLIKNFLGTGAVETINDRAMTTRVDGKQVSFYKNSQASTKQDASGSRLELRNQDARYKEVAKRFVNGVLCQALDVMARDGNEHPTLSATEPTQLKKETTAAPNDKDVKIRDAVNVFVDNVIANAVDVIRGEMNLTTSLQEVTDVVDSPTKEVPILNDEQLALVRVNWDEVKVIMDTEVKDFEEQEFAAEVSGEQDDNADLLAEGCGHVMVSLDQVKVAVDGQVKVEPEVSEKRDPSAEASATNAEPTTAICIEVESADAKDEETVDANTHNMLEDKAFDKTDGTDGDQKTPKVQKKELFSPSAVMMEDHIFVKSMSYFTRLLEDTTFDEERLTQLHTQVSGSLPCKDEEISIVRPDDGRSLAASEVEARRIHEVLFEREIEEDREEGKTIARPSDGKVSNTSDVGHDRMKWMGEEYAANNETNSMRESDNGRPSDTDAGALQDMMASMEESRQASEGKTPITRPGDSTRESDNGRPSDTDAGAMQDTMASMKESRQASKGKKAITRPGEGFFTKEKCKNVKMEDSNEMKQSDDDDVNQRNKDSPCVMQSDAIALRPMGNWRQVSVNEKSKEKIGAKKGSISEIRGILWSESLTPLGSWSPKPFFVEDDATSRASKEKKKTRSLDSVDVQKKVKGTARECHSLTKESSNINPPPFIVPSGPREVIGRKPLPTKMKTALVHLYGRQKQKDTIPSLPDSKKQRPLEPLSASLSRLSSGLTNSNHRYQYTKVNTDEDSKKTGNSSSSMMMNLSPLTLRCRDETLYEKNNEKEYECDPEDIAHAMEVFNHVRQALSFDGLVSTALVSKFMLARDLNVDDAASLYKNYLSLRRTYNKTDLNPFDEPLRSELFSGRFTVLDSRDQQGAAIAVFTAHLHFADISHEIVMNNIYLQLDQTMKSVETQRQGMVLIYDFTNITNRTCDIHLCSKIFELLLSAYPVRLKKIFIVSPPFWFKVEMQLISAAFRDTKYRKNIHIVTQPGLQDHLPVTCIPMDLGGDCQASPVRLIERCLSSYRNCAGMMEKQS